MDVLVDARYWYTLCHESIGSYSYFAYLRRVICIPVSGLAVGFDRLRTRLHLVTTSPFAENFAAVSPYAKTALADVAKTSKSPGLFHLRTPPDRDAWPQHSRQKIAEAYTEEISQIKMTDSRATAWARDAA